MKKGSVLNPVLVVLLVASFSLPVFAQAGTILVDRDKTFRHSIIYEVEGRIRVSREIGHACTTGAVKKQEISGYANLKKTENIRINNNIMQIDEVSDWNTASDAIAGLIVTTTLQLCSRPLSVAAETYTISPAHTVYGGRSLVLPYHPFVVDGLIRVRGLTQQLWATSVSSNPGESGSYHADFIAAYGPGPYEREFGVRGPTGDFIYYDDKFLWEFDENVSFFLRDDKLRGYKRGINYVGNYFTIEQYAYTSGGDLKRFISMSNPFEGTLLEEDLRVIGMASVRESFDMHVLKRGKKGVTLAWYELF